MAYDGDGSVATTTKGYLLVQRKMDLFDLWRWVAVGLPAIFTSPSSPQYRQTFLPAILEERSFACCFSWLVYLDVVEREVLYLRAVKSTINHTNYYRHPTPASLA